MLQSSVLFTGTQNLINDAITVLMILGMIVGIACFCYFGIRRSAADEMDQKKWGNRMSNAVICTIAVELGMVIIKLVLSYYGITA